MSRTGQALSQTNSGKRTGDIILETAAGIQQCTINRILRLTGTRRLTITGLW